MVYREYTSTSCPKKANLASVTQRIIRPSSFSASSDCSNEDDSKPWWNYEKYKLPFVQQFQLFVFHTSGPLTHNRFNIFFKWRQKNIYRFCSYYQMDKVWCLQSSSYCTKKCCTNKQMSVLTFQNFNFCRHLVSETQQRGTAALVCKGEEKCSCWMSLDGHYYQQFYLQKIY